MMAGSRARSRSLSSFRRGSARLLMPGRSVYATMKVCRMRNLATALALALVLCAAPARADDVVFNHVTVVDVVEGKLLRDPAGATSTMRPPATRTIWDSRRSRRRARPPSTRRGTSVRQASSGASGREWLQTSSLSTATRSPTSATRGASPAWWQMAATWTARRSTACWRRRSEWRTAVGTTPSTGRPQKVSSRS
jgi:hypothetical protein